MRNYEKSIKWIEEGIIPEFLKQDMRKYMQNDELVIEKKFILNRGLAIVLFS